MEMTELTQPHDKFSKALLEDPSVVLVLLRERLPRELAELLADDAPELVGGDFVDEALRESRSDRLYRVRLRCPGVLHVFILLEHKSFDDDPALQLLGYLVQTWGRLALECAGAKKLPPIVPVVLYHGATRWKGPRTFLELVEPIAAKLGVKPLDFGIVLIDLGAIDDDALSKEPTLRAGLLTLKYATREKLQAGRLRVILGALGRAPRILKVALRYIVGTYRGIDRKRLFDNARKAIPQEEERIMTVAEELREEGRKEGRKRGRKEGRREGRKEGRKEGRAEMVLRLLVRRFKSVSGEVRARVMAASAADLEVWLDRAVDAPTLDAVFTPPH